MTADTQCNLHICGVDYVFGEGRGRGPGQLRGVDLNSGKQADGETREHGGQHDVAPRIFDLLRHGGDAIKADVGQHGDRCAVQQASCVEAGRVVEGDQPRVPCGPYRHGDVANGKGQKDDDHDAHAQGEHRVHAAGGLHTDKIQPGEDDDKGERPRGVGDLREHVLRSRAAPDGADDGVEHVIHEHGPADNVARHRMNLIANIGVG